MVYLVAILIIAGGIVVVVGELSASKELEKIQAWPETTGEIIAFNLSRSYIGDYFASIQYRYEVDGVRYMGETIRPGGRMNFRSKRLAREIESRYRTGAVIPVYYDPDNPEHCCVDREETAAGKAAILWGLAVIALGGFVLIQKLGG